MADGTDALPIVVLTGGIASGKTAVSDRLARLGVPVIDTDRLARELVEPGSSGLSEVVSAFGPTVLSPDGTLDRKRVGHLIFDDPEARQKLESILHPRIEAAARARVGQLKNAPYCVLVVPLLIETGLFPDADLVVVVDIPEALQRERLHQRDAIDDALIDRILAAQAGRQQRLARADRVLDNSGTPADLQAQVDHLHQALLARFARPD
ncbi:MAG: dephospho-CoA kinase [Wenzhouxiangella sp.]